MRALSALSIVWVLSLTLAFAAEEPGVDIKELAKQIRVMESVINENLAQTFRAPFAYLNRARGVYLPGYGVVFTIEVDLNQTRMLTPFDTPPTGQRLRDLEQQQQRRRDQAKELAQKVLAQYGDTLTELKPTDSVAVVINTFNVREQGIERGTIVYRAQRQLLDQLRSKSLQQAAFQQKLEVTEY